jgi:hypothetical protein
MVTLLIILGILAVFSVILGIVKRFKRRVLEPTFMIVALFGIVALCQPLFFWLYQVGFAILLTGTLGFIVAIHMKGEAS